MKGKLISSVAALAVLSACADTATIGKVSTPRAGFAAVADRSQRAQTGTPAWHLSAAEIAAAEAQTKALIEGKTISADTAVRAALLNNRGLQASYAELGLSATDVWEAALGPVPTIGVSVSGLAGDVTRTLEATLLTAVLDAATAKPRTKVAELRFEQAQLAAAGETIALAIETRRAWIEAVAAFEAAGLIAQTQNAANAASELATELGRTGALNRADQAREHAFNAEVAAERADARLEAQLAKERLARLMGVSLGQMTFYVPDALPGLPGGPRSQVDIERLALQNRVDLAAGRLELQAIAADYRLTGQTRAVSDISLMAGIEIEREDGETDRNPVLEVEFEIPLYDTGKLISRRGSLEYLKAANMLAESAVGARAEARAAHKAVTGKHSVARHWRDVVLPLRRTIDEEALLSYNGMITSTFELLEDARDGLEAQLSAAEAKRDYWLAETSVTAAIWGGSASVGGDEEGDDE
ncbi:Outer membrane protein TolC [Lutimaribacter pacificus]|jgi:outer membrane protein TolC|uniref:Outer membrane protein TolC n=1 Tax=Lutimaribacter pacificus TaxID=391948 RepID=A0A1H0MGM8_9RHOB|nr:TolC family protein [Lutimaribacter pacificus]SDO79589.1 Outer membrane protein TolC [Lutimaribacter pacificus]SHK91495.1 Outer membrane protein TolC [Lutimaribacter pacificus]